MLYAHNGDPDQTVHPHCLTDNLCCIQLEAPGLPSGSCSRLWIMRPIVRITLKRNSAYNCKMLIAQILSLSNLHRLDMTKIMLKG